LIGLNRQYFQVTNQYPMRIIAFLLSVCFISCSSPTMESKIVKRDNIEVVVSGVSADLEVLEKEQENHRKEIVSEYAKSLTIDTSFSTANNTYTVFLKHYCTWDSALIVPAKYNFDTEADFMTHNFQSELTVLEGVDTAFKRIITKADFSSQLYPALKNYATLSFPTLKLKTDSIEVFYSVSIPVTDVGIGASIQFDTKGKFTIIQ
jgi:hypothetical protein